MARYPEWFDRLDAIIETLRHASDLDRLGRREMKAAFGCSERDSVRLLHKFGAEERGDALSLPRSALLVQLEALQSGATYGAFLRQRREVARQLDHARAERVAQRFEVQMRAEEDRPLRFEDLPQTITWRRATADAAGRFAIVYQDGADLMRQLAQFLGAAGLNQEEFFADTEPSNDGVR